MKAAKTKKRRVFDAAMNVKTIKEKFEKKANIYLEKIAKEGKDRPGYGAATGTELKSVGRSFLDGVGGAALGAGVGLLALKTKTGAKAAIRAKKALGVGKGSAVTKAVATAPLAYAGYAAGGIHGALASTKNSLNKAYDKGQEKSASAKDLAAVAKKVGSKVEDFVSKRKAISAGISAGAGGYLAGRLVSKVDAKIRADHEKKAGILSTALGTAKNFAKGAVKDVAKVGRQASVVGSGAVTGNMGRVGKGLKMLASNKAVQTGAGLVGAGIVAGKMNKQAQENKYLARVAGFR